MAVMPWADHTLGIYGNSGNVLQRPWDIVNHGSAGVDKGGDVGVVVGGCWYGYGCQMVVQAQSESQKISGNVQFNL